jgi:hypothetical protein
VPDAQAEHVGFEEAEIERREAGIGDEQRRRRHAHEDDAGRGLAVEKRAQH